MNNIRCHFSWQMLFFNFEDFPGRFSMESAFFLGHEKGISLYFFNTILISHNTNGEKKKGRKVKKGLSVRLEEWLDRLVTGERVAGHVHTASNYESVL